MRLPALKHLLGAVQALARAQRICVLGSSALLASFPELGEAGGPLELSFDADLLVEPCDEQLAAMLHEAVAKAACLPSAPATTRTFCGRKSSRPCRLAGKPGW